MPTIEAVKQTTGRSRDKRGSQHLTHGKLARWTTEADVSESHPVRSSSPSGTRSRCLSLQERSIPWEPSVESWPEAYEFG